MGNSRVVEAMSSHVSCSRTSLRVRNFPWTKKNWYREVLQYMISRDIYHRSFQIGNVFVLLFAGHGESSESIIHHESMEVYSTRIVKPETTGHTLAAVLGFLGIYQEEQDDVYEQILSVVGNNRDPVRIKSILT